MDSSVNKPKKDRGTATFACFEISDGPEVTEITINRPAEVWIKTFKGLEAHRRRANASYLQALANAIVVFNGVQPLKSIVAVVLPGGQRGQVIMPPACIDGTLSLSIQSIRWS